MIEIILYMLLFLNQYALIINCDPGIRRYFMQAHCLFGRFVDALALRILDM